MYLFYGIYGQFRIILDPKKYQFDKKIILDTHLGPKQNLRVTHFGENRKIILRTSEKSWTPDIYTKTKNF